MNYQLAKNSSVNLKKEDLIQKLVQKNKKNGPYPCEGGGGICGVPVF
ncbi:hypothetical protein C900_03988 [Fulvivirga imtechensis AK7]|uniref:Uncharacterized protein n=1 Tax=Fulvivirga imtechensis AK7 TaxID=1237149 RepID=L8JQ42_9BACT|nr:hypothetical protein C900_03988 [Fulvivirga imtechensis AK7]